MEDLLALGAENGTAELHPRKYSVVSADQTYRGEIQVGVTFTSKVLTLLLLFLLRVNFVVCYMKVKGIVCL